MLDCRTWILIWFQGCPVFSAVPCSSPQWVHYSEWWGMLCSFRQRHVPQKKGNVISQGRLSTIQLGSPEPKGPVLLFLPHSPCTPMRLHAPTCAYTHRTHDAYTDHTHHTLLSHPCTSSASHDTPSPDSSALQRSRKLSQKETGKPSKKQESLSKQLFWTSTIPAI